MKDEMYNEINRLLDAFDNQPNPDDPNINWEGEFYTLLVELEKQWYSLFYDEYMRGYYDSYN